jgi:hypothetical protein
MLPMRLDEIVVLFEGRQSNAGTEASLIVA